MMDPLSITASVVGITTAALQSAQFLAKTIENVRDAPSAVTDINADLRAVETVLQNLDNILQGDSSQIIPSDQIKHAVENCEHWMRHSTEEKTFWIDRWRIGLFGQERIKTFKGQLSDCKGTLSVALSTATIITTSRQENLMKEMKDMMLQQNEFVLRQQIVRADNETAELERSVQHITVGGSTEADEESEQSKEELLEELKRQQAANTTLRDMCEEALSQTVYERTGQKIKGVKATNDSSAIAGFINTSGEELKINQDISDVTADNRSFTAAGVIGNVDFNDLRPGWSGGDNARRKS